MDRAGDVRERERGLDRVLTFVDAVVAIAITLLVLPLAELVPEVGDGSVTDLLREHDDELLTIVLLPFPTSLVAKAPDQAATKVSTSAPWRSVRWCWRWWPGGCDGSRRSATAIPAPTR